MRRKAALAISILALSGCSYTQIAAMRAAEASDESLNAFIWGICKATPVGAINRKFNTPEERQVYDAFCEAAQLP
jgi:hypothetical protein